MNDSKRPEYRHWVNMKSRCCNPNTPFFKHYGGRGIVVCDRWLNSFAAFFEDMGERPSPKHSLDRIDFNGDYEPNNCRWATPTQQRRNTSQNRFVTIAGVRMSLADAVDGTGLVYNTVLHRLRRGWPLDLALTRPLQRGVPPLWRTSDAA